MTKRTTSIPTPETLVEVLDESLDDLNDNLKRSVAGITLGLMIASTLAPDSFDRLKRKALRIVHSAEEELVALTKRVKEADDKA